jgi:hypothetical protein
MCEVKTTEYTFIFKRKLQVTVHGTDTEKNFCKAMEEAARQARVEISSDWLIDVEANEYTDCEKDYKEENNVGVC